MAGEEVRPQESASGSARRKGKKSLPWRQDREILSRIAEVERRLAAGENVPTIALALEVGESTVKDDRKRGLALYVERTGDQVEQQRADTIRRLEAVVATALGQARFDYEAARAVLFGTTAHGIDGEELTLSTPEVGDDFRGVIKMPDYRGSPAASLAVARAALMDIAKLRGLVVDKVAPTDADGKTLDLASLVALARTEKH